MAQWATRLADLLDEHPAPRRSCVPWRGRSSRGLVHRRLRRHWVCAPVAGRVHVRRHISGIDAARAAPGWSAGGAGDWEDTILGVAPYEWLRSVTHLTLPQRLARCGTMLFAFCRWGWCQ
jgi:hypothetical protein